MGDKSKKQVKVDNWGMFFLQRLQQHFAKSEFCDLTLHFCNDQEVKAHRLVLDVCTEYFQMLAKQGRIEGNVVTLPEDMQPDVVIPVINFMYTGRLEFHTEIQERLYATAQKMKMTVLTKLLDAQSLNVQQKQQQQQQSRLQVKSPATRVTPTKKSFAPGTFINLQGKRISPQQLDPNLPQMLPGRKLPIWTRRCIPQQSHMGSNASSIDRPIRIFTSAAAAVDETPRPTRFEWPDDNEDESPSPLTTTFEDISYESKPLMQLREQGAASSKSKSSMKASEPVAGPVAKKATFEDVLRTGAVAKRPATSPLPGGEATEAKRRAMNLQDVKDYVQEAQVRQNMAKEESDEEDVDNDLAMMDTDDEDEETSSVHHVTPHKSILKTQSSHEEDPAGQSAKKVRFSLGEAASLEEKENSTGKVEQKALPTRAASNISAGSTPHVTNHAKIITEVLKKYPHLVKNNKNIRLKIMQRGGGSSAAQVVAEKDASGRPVKSKVSYVVLKSDVSGARGKSTSLGIKHGGLVEQFSSLDPQQKLASGAENITGPWLCHACGTNEEPVHLETYYEYRHHLQDVHMEKIDARICEHCGHRASKRNLLLYHLFTKHGVQPPRNCQFPKCDQCEYVALSESLLIKHRNNHSNNRDFVCKVCNATFKSNGALQGHMQTNLHSDPYKKPYECPFCQKLFVRNINLKAHVRVSHKDMVKRFSDNDEDMDLDELGDEGEGQVMEVPVIDMMNQNAAEGMTILAEHPDRSSEAEGLSHVASGIAASLGLADGQQTVILLDENQEFIIQTTEIVGNEYITDDTALVQEVQEYIVPEMVNDQPTTNENEQGLIEYTDEGQPLHGTEEVLMILTDHCYAEEVVVKDDERNRQQTHVIQNGDVDEHGLVENQSHEVNGATIDGVTVDQNVYTTEDTHTLVPVPPDETERVPSDTKVNFSKPAVEMSDLLDEWDEELSQEADSTVARQQEAMPTRGDVIPQEIYSVAAPTRNAGATQVEQRPRPLVANYKSEEEESPDNGESSEAMKEEEEETSLPAEIEQQRSLLVDAEDMAHDSASLMAETGDSNALVMDIELDASFPQETEDTAAFSEETAQQHVSYSVASEPSVSFTADTADDVKFTAESQQTATPFAAGTGENVTFSASADQSEQLAAQMGPSVQFPGETQQLTIFCTDRAPPSFLPFTETEVPPTFVPFAKSVQKPMEGPDPDEPSTQLVLDTDQVTSLASASILTDGTAMLGGQHVTLFAQTDSKLRALEPDASLPTAEGSVEHSSLSVEAQQTFQEDVDHKPSSVNAALL